MYERILVAVDGSPTSDQGVAEAIRLAKLTGGRLEFIHVVDLLKAVNVADSWFGMRQDFFAVLRKGGEEVLARARNMAEAAGLESEVKLFDQSSDRVCDVVADEARQWNADVLVLGTHGRRGVGRLVLGSDAEQILRISPVPVLLVRGQEPSGEADQG